MNRNASLTHVALAVALVLLQALLFQSVHFLSVVPLFYVYAVLRWPSDMPRWLQVLAGFVVGLAVDMLLDTLGMHAIATTLVAYLRQPMLASSFSGETEGFSPGEKTMGLLDFWKYAAVLVLVHHFTLYLVESFSFFSLWWLLSRTLGSTALTLLLVFLLERFRGRARH